MKAMMIALIAGTVMPGSLHTVVGSGQASEASPAVVLRTMNQSGNGPLDEAQLKALGVALSALEDAPAGDRCDETTATIASLAARAGQDERIQDDALRYLRNRLSTDVSPRAFAVLTDRIKVEHGQPQEYGTIFRTDQGEAVAYAASEAMKFNEMRDSIGLAPVEVEARVVGDLAKIDSQLLDRFRRPGINDCRFRMPDNAVRSELKMRSSASDQARTGWEKDNFAPDTESYRKAQEEDAKSANWVRESIDQNLLFSGSGVNRQDIFDAAMLVQHSGSLSLMKDALPIFSSLMIENRFGRAGYALMVDRVLVFEKKQQIYGSQGIESDGKVVPEKTIDASGVDARRRLMNLMAIEDYYKELSQ